MKRFIFLAVLWPAVALGQTPEQETILLPRGVAVAALNWIGQPDATSAVKLFAALNACINDNPQGGRVVRMGPDQCPEVTAGLAARDKALADKDKQIADLQKQLDAAKAKPAP